MSTTRLTNGFSERKKKITLGQTAHFWPKNYVFISFKEFFFKLCTMKEAKWYIEIILMVFLKKILIWIHPKDFSEIWHNESGQDIQGNYIVFLKKWPIRGGC